MIRPLQETDWEKDEGRVTPYILLFMHQFYPKVATVPWFDAIAADNVVIPSAGYD